MTKQAILKELQDLSTDDKLEVLYRLWDQVTAELEGRPPTTAERQYLDDRLRDLEADPRGDRSWNEVRDDLLSDR